MPSTNKKKPAPASARGGASSAKKSDLEGRKAPAFTLADTDGNPVSLSELIGRSNLVLYFYPRDMTPGCTTEACDFRDSLASVRKAGAQIVGVSADGAASHQKFTEKHGLNFPLLSDIDNKVGKLYGVYKKKSLYGREFMGIERTTFLIDRTGIIRKVFPKVKVAGHAVEVVAALKEIR